MCQILFIKRSEQRQTTTTASAARTEQPLGLDGAQWHCASPDQTIIKQQRVLRPMWLQKHFMLWYFERRTRRTER